MTAQLSNDTPRIASELDRIAREYLQAHESKYGTLPTVPYEKEWQSTAICGRQNDDTVFWRPTLRQDSFSFDGLSSALETALPEHCTEYFGHFWSGSLPVIWGERSFELLQLWNHEDENNLMHNLLGHLLEKKRVREPASVFFAVVDDARFLSVSVESGAVMLEEVGGDRPEEVAADLPSLLAAVTAVAVVDSA